MRQPHHADKRLRTFIIKTKSANSWYSLTSCIQNFMPTPPYLPQPLNFDINYTRKGCFVEARKIIMGILDKTLNYILIKLEFSLKVKFYRNSGMKLFYKERRKLFSPSWMQLKRAKRKGCQWEMSETFEIKSTQGQMKFACKRIILLTLGVLMLDRSTGIQSLPFFLFIFSS